MKMNLDGLHDLLGNEAVTEAVALLVLEVECFHEMTPRILKCKVLLVNSNHNKVIDRKGKCIYQG